MLQESIIWGRMNSNIRDPLKENNWLQEIMWDLKICVDLLENREKEMAKRTLCNCSVPTSTDTGDMAWWR